MTVNERPEFEKLSYIGSNHVSSVASPGNGFYEAVLNKYTKFSITTGSDHKSFSAVRRFGSRVSPVCAVTGEKLSVKNSRTISKLLHTIGNFERISDHALNLTESAKEIAEKRIVMSDSAMEELEKLGKAIAEIVQKTIDAYTGNNVAMALEIS